MIAKNPWFKQRQANKTYDYEKKIAKWTVNVQDKTLIGNFQCRPNRP